eukprot:593696-Pleurochrysis_carterae.AAC.1
MPCSSRHSDAKCYWHSDAMLVSAFRCQVILAFRCHARDSARCMYEHRCCASRCQAERTAIGQAPERRERVSKRSGLGERQRSHEVGFVHRNRLVASSKSAIDELRERHAIL